MGLSIYNIKKWTKMLTGKSIMHVNQDMGKYFVPGEIKGYFNNLTEKVLNDPETLRLGCVPMTTDEKAGNVYFPIAIFQYGLGAYDLYIETGDDIYFQQFKRCVEWAVQKQEINGAWDNFGFVQPNAPYSSMCQGEGCSLLLRAYKETNDLFYYSAAKNAIEYMLLPLEENGTAEYKGNEIFLYEYTNKPCVLNGWIFSIFGIYEYYIISNDQRIKSIFYVCMNTLKKHLHEYDCGYWSYYDNGGLIASPFYHDLHIAQLEALYLIENDTKIDEMHTRFLKYKNNWGYRKIAFLKKVFQKIREK